MRTSRTNSVLAILPVVLLAAAVDARPCRINLIPNGNSFGCDACHDVPGGPRNAFGADIERLIASSSSCSIEFWGPELAMEDSDDDGILNGEELLDPMGLWTRGDANPGNPLDATNPGEFNCPEQGEPGFADTHCAGLVISGPDGNAPGTYTITAEAVDEDDQQIFYTFMADNGQGEVFATGRETKDSFEFELSAGTWTITVEVDDMCFGLADDAICEETIVVAAAGVSYQRGDSNTDGAVDLSDGVNILNVLFLGTGNITCDAAADSNASGAIDLSDGVNIFNLLFLGTGNIPPPNACGEVFAGEDECASYPPCEAA